MQYPAEKIGTYDLDFNETAFTLLNKQAACLAEDQCGIPVSKQKITVAAIASPTNSCILGGGCYKFILYHII